MKVLKHWKKILLSLLLIAVLVVTVGLPYLFARLVTRAGTRPQDRALTSSPSDYGLAFEDVSFMSSDGVRLSGWSLGGADSDVAIAVGHGLFRSRREALDRAAFFRREGFDTLVFDFRRHGESAGERVTLGFDERKDFLGAVQFLRKERPERKVVLYGVSMGAAAALLATAESPAVAAAVADSSFISIDHTVVHHLDLIFGLPRFPFGSALLFFLELETGFDREAFDLVDAVGRIGDRPVLILAGEADRRMAPELQRQLKDASASAHSGFRSFEDAGHGAAYRTHPEAYEETVREFLSAAGLATRPAPAEDAGADSSLESR